MLGIKLKGDRGDVKGGLVANSNEFLQCWARGALTPDLAVAEFWSWCRQMVLASAYVLHLESSGPGFRGVEQRLGEQAEVQRYTRPEMLERTCRERGKESR